MARNQPVTFWHRLQRRIRATYNWMQNRITALVQISFRQFSVHLVTVVLAMLTLSLLYNFVQQVIQSANLEAQRAELEAEVAALEEENLHLQGAAEYAESNAHVERLARERLNLAREGDIVVLADVLAPPATSDAEEPQQTPELPPAAPNWQRWWEAFVEHDQHPTILIQNNAPDSTP